MKKTRFSDNQIVNILKRAEQGILSNEYECLKSDTLQDAMTKEW